MVYRKTDRVDAVCMVMILVLTGDAEGGVEDLRVSFVDQQAYKESEVFLRDALLYQELPH